MTKKYWPFFILLGLFVLSANHAQAADNGPTEIIIGTIGMLIIAAVVMMFAHQADTASQDPSDGRFANQQTLQEKLRATLSPDRQYFVDVVRQSGNLERTMGPLSVSDVATQILSTMRRANIDTVSIVLDGSVVRVMRTVHNARGRQEGKRIGGFIIR